jgi:hypothetical protein
MVWRLGFTPQEMGRVKLVGTPCNVLNILTPGNLESLNKPFAVRKSSCIYARIRVADDSLLNSHDAVGGMDTGCVRGLQPRAAADEPWPAQLIRTPLLP